MEGEHRQMTIQVETWFILKEPVKGWEALIMHELRVDNYGHIDEARPL